MMRTILLLAVLLAAFGCSDFKKEQTLYHSKEFTITSSTVTQGKYRAKALSSNEIQSNYVSTAHQIFPRRMEFKFSINEKDNELPVGVNHSIILGDKTTSDTIRFGQQMSLDQLQNKESLYLPANFEYTIYVDLSPVFEQMEKQGYYLAPDGSKIAKADFKSVCIAGSALPLSWDWVNLEEKSLQLQQMGESNIYSIRLIFNPFDENAPTDRTWKKSVPTANYPTYTSDQMLLDALYQMSLEEAKMAIEPDSTFRTGAKWGGVWTRDVSYSTLLNFGMMEPEVAKISLKKKVNRDRIIQDTGSGGAWPVSSDRTAWALAAWEIYLSTGDQEWLQYAYTVIKNSLEDDYQNLFDPMTGLYRGESSFIDWREQSYPRWMNNADIYQSENLGTNAVHYQAHIICAEMAGLLGESAAVFLERAEKIKAGMNEHLWMEDKGYYAQYLYGRDWQLTSERFETLGEAFSILFGIADTNQTRLLLASAPLTAYGATVFYPQIPGIPSYHNNAIWPFVQSFWNLAAAKSGNEQVLTHGMASVIRAAALFLTNYENMVAENGDYQGTEINSHRMLWSMAGYMSMIHKVLMGIHLQPDGIHFQPVIPVAYQGERKLSGFHYRKAILNISIKGYGTEIESCKVNGKTVDQAFVPADAEGTVDVEITMKSNPFPQNQANFVANHFSPGTPEIQWNLEAAGVKDIGVISWKKVEKAALYQLYSNGEKLLELTDTFYHPEAEMPAEISVTAVDSLGYESFASEPLRINDRKSSFRLEMENGQEKHSIPAINYSGRGFVSTSVTEQPILEKQFNCPVAGLYLVKVRYANGTGPWNTDNNCCVRTFYLNGINQGVLVLPQRGVDEWSDWGYSNTLKILLPAGKNSIKIALEPWNTNMDVQINECLIDFIDFRLAE